MQLDNYGRFRLSYDTFVLGEAAIIYMATPKVACTSFKHVMATLGGTDFAGLAASLTPAVTTDEMAIHDRALVAVPSLLDLTEEQRAHVLASPDFLRFCIVRNPYRRLASAWLDRMLCHSLSPLAPILKHVPFPPYVADWSYLRARFAEFVDHLYRHEAPSFSNHHWQQQHALLMPQLLNYNLVIKLEQLAEKLPVIIAHVEKHGLTWPGLPRINETPFKYDSRLYTAASARKVAAMYEIDFSSFGYPATLDRAGPQVALPDVELVTAIQKRNRRIFYLSLKTRGLL